MRDQPSPVKGNEVRASTPRGRAFRIFSCLLQQDVLLGADASNRKRPRPSRPGPGSRSSRPFEALVAFAVIAAALLDPLQAAIGARGLVGVVLIEAGVHACLSGALLGVFLIDR